MAVLEFISGIFLTAAIFCTLLGISSFLGWLLGIVSMNAPVRFARPPTGALAAVLRWGLWAVAGVIMFTGAALIFTPHWKIGVPLAIIGFLAVQVGAYGIGRAQAEKLFGRRRAARDARDQAAAAYDAQMTQHPVIEHDPHQDTAPLPVVHPTAAPPATPKPMTPSQYAESIASDEYPIARPSND